MGRGYDTQCSSFALVVLTLAFSMLCTADTGSHSSMPDCRSTDPSVPFGLGGDASPCTDNENPSAEHNKTDSEQNPNTTAENNKTDSEQNPNTTAENNKTDSEQHPNTTAGITKMLLGIRAPYCAAKLCAGYHDWQCFCDASCLLFKDCCYSVIDQIIAKNNLLKTNESDQLSFNIESHIQSLYSDDTVALIRYMDCVVDKDGKNGYMMVNTCPEMNTKEAVKCTHSQHYGYSSVPVDYETKSRIIITFRNIHCAFCNNIKFPQVKFWKVYAACSANVTIQNDMSLADISDVCNVGVKSKYEEMRLRTCIDKTKYKTYEHGRGDRGRDIATLCDYYLYTIKPDDEATVYRNPHCIAFTENTTQIGKYRCTTIGDRNGANGIPKDEVNLQVLFDFNKQGGMVPTVSCASSIPCTDKEVFDCISKRCRKLICPLRREAYKGKCIKVNETVSKFDVSTPVDKSELTMPLSVSLIEINLKGIKEARKAEAITDQLKGVFVNLYKTAGIIIEYDFYYVENQANGKPVLIVVLNTGDDIVSSIPEIVQRLSDEGIGIASVYQDVRIRNFETIELLECDNGTVFIDKAAVLDEDDINRVILSKHNIETSTSAGKWVINFKNDITVDTFVVCLTPISHPSLNCPMIAYTEDEAYIEGETVFVINTSLTFRPGDYELHKGLIFVCSGAVTKQNALTDIFEYSNHFRVLSIATSAFSIVALSVIIVVHMCISDLRNMHGLNLSALSLTILTIHVLLLIQSKISNDKTCFLFAVILHTVLLSMFVWMNIIGTDMALMFQSKVYINKKNPSTRFKKYVTISLVIPVIIVAIGVGVNFTNLGIRPGYGEMDICWISNSLGVITFIACPVGISLVLNYGLFAFTVCTIQKARRQTKRVRTQGERAYILVYLKLTVILGFTWIIGLLGPVIRSEAVWLFHIALNGLQGVGLLICFVVNARVIKRMKEKSMKYTESTTNSKRGHSIAISETMTTETMADSIKHKE